MDLFGFNISRKTKDNNLITKDIITTRDRVIRFENHSMNDILGRFNPYRSKNLFTLFKEISEIQFPIRYITDKAKNAKFVVKSFKNDSIVWDNAYFNKLLDKPNPFYSFNDYIANSLLMRLVDGNSFCYAAADPNFSKAFYKYANAFYVLPSFSVNIEQFQNINPFSGDEIEKVIRYYDTYYAGKRLQIPPQCILHIKDSVNFSTVNNDLKGFSRLASQKYPISNLMAVYEARNVIYTKRGALGALVPAKDDGAGSANLTNKEKENLRKDFNEDYGIDYKKGQIIISDVPLNYLQIGMSIQDLEPFKETINDAVQIGGIYGLDPSLLPREDKDTYTNKETAEAAFYPNVIFPLLAEECRLQSNFMGLTEAGYYIDYYFDNVPVLELSKNKKEEANKKLSEKCLIEFNNGLITLNQWRVQLGMEEVKEQIYNKTMLQMNDTERAIIISLRQSKTIQS